MSGAPIEQRPEAVGRVWALAASAIMLAVFGVAAVGSLFYPFGRDQGIFAWVGDRILAGGVPFRDAWDQKGPATHYTYALVELAFGRGLWGIRVFDLLAVVATQGAIFRLVRPRVGWFAAITSAMAFGCLHYRLNDWNTAQPDAWGGMLALASVAVLARPRHGASAAPAPRAGTFGPEIAAGALIGLAALYKATLALMLLAPLAYAIADARSSRRPLFPRALALGAGFSLPVAFGLAWLAALGGLEAFWQIQWVFNRLVHGGYTHPLAAHLHALHAVALRCGLYLPLLFAAVAAALWWRRERALTLALITAVGTGLLLLVGQRQYFLYHAAPAFASLAVLAGVGATQLPARLRGGRRSALWVRAIAAPALALALMGAVRPPFNIAGYRTYVLHDMPVATYRAQFGRADFPVSVYWDVAEYIRETTRPDESVLVWGFEPMIAYLANRRQVSRFGFHYPLTACRWPWLEASASLTALCHAYREEMIAAFRADPPAVVAIAFDDATILTPRSSRDELMRFPELRGLILDQYVRDRTIGNFELWQRADRTRP